MWQRGQRCCTPLHICPGVQLRLRWERKLPFVAVNLLAISLSFPAALLSFFSYSADRNNYFEHFCASIFSESMYYPLRFLVLSMIPRCFPKLIMVFSALLEMLCKHWSSAAPTHSVKILHSVFCSHLWILLIIWAGYMFSWVVLNWDLKSTGASILQILLPRREIRVTFKRLQFLRKEN